MRKEKTYGIFILCLVGCFLLQNKITAQSNQQKAFQWAEQIGGLGKAQATDTQGIIKKPWR